MNRSLADLYQNDGELATVPINAPLQRVYDLRVRHRLRRKTFCKAADVVTAAGVLLLAGVILLACWAPAYIGATPVEVRRPDRHPRLAPPPAKPQLPAATQSAPATKPAAAPRATPASRPRPTSSTKPATRSVVLPRVAATAPTTRRAPTAQAETTRASTTRTSTLDAASQPLMTPTSRGAGVTTAP